MLLPRRLLVLLASLVLGLGAAGPAWAQSAGDEQYSDPLGQSEPGGDTGSPPSLSDAPQGSPPGSSGSGSSGSSGSGSTAPDQAGSGSGAGDDAAAGTATGGGEGTPAPTRLPNTGADAGVIGAFGLALVLLGIGLRLRTADARP